MTTTGNENERKRRRFLCSKIIFALLVCFVLAGVAGRIWWGYVAQARLDEALCRIKARGEPVTWADLAPEPIPDDRNAALLYKKLEDMPLLHVTPVDWSDLGLSSVSTQPDTQPGDSERERIEHLREVLDETVGNRGAVRDNAEDIREILGRGREALLLCRQARSLKGSDWGVDYKSTTTYEYDLGAVVPWACLRQSAKLLSVAALEAHERGRDDQAMEYVLDILALSDSVDSTPIVISHLMAIAMDALATTALEEMVFDLRIGNEVGQVGREDLQGLIGELLDTTARREALTRVFISENCIFQQTFEAMKRGEIPIDGQGISASHWRTDCFAPMWTMNQVTMVRLCEALVEASRQSTYPAGMRAYRARLPEAYISPEPGPGAVRLAGKILPSILAPSLERVYLLHYRWLAHARMAALALAIRAYEVREGHRPEGLQELVGKYISSVPDDPFAEAGVKLLYLPDAESPVIYSISENGLDDGGSEEMAGEVVTRGPADRVFYLNGDRPREPDETDDRFYVILDGKRVPISELSTSQPTCRPASE